MKFYAVCPDGMTLIRAVCISCIKKKIRNERSDRFAETKVSFRHDKLPKVSEDECSYDDLSVRQQVPRRREARPKLPSSLGTGIEEALAEEEPRSLRSFESPTRRGVGRGTVLTAKRFLRRGGNEEFGPKDTHRIDASPILQRCFDRRSRISNGSPPYECDFL